MWCAEVRFMLVRILAGLLALGAAYSVVAQLRSPDPGYVWLWYLVGVVCMGLYAVGGQPLLERVLPMFKEKDDKKQPPPR
jgi:hypothetical protein